MNDDTGDTEGKSEDLPPLLQEGTLVDRYVIKRMVGRGGMGEVYEAVHQDIKKRVAIKTLDPSLSRNAEARTRFVREGEAASRIQHPHIVSVTDVGTHEGMLYLVMEFLDGEDLDARISREGALSPEQTADVMIPVLSAVSTAHQAGVVHRDLKPSNIFLAKNPHGDPIPKVLDFGISKLIDPQSHSITRSAAMIGTPLYMAPEQAHSSKASDARSDQYSLGVILYQCLTGKVPFEAETFFHLMSKIVTGEFPPPRTIRPEIPEELEAIILRAMAKEPSDRFASVQEFGRALLPFAGEEVRVVFRRLFGNPGETSKLKALTPDISGANPINPRSSTPALASTMSAAAAERPSTTTPPPNDKRSMAPIAGAGLLLLLLVGFGLRGAFSSPPASAVASAVPAPVAPRPVPVTDAATPATAVATTDAGTNTAAQAATPPATTPATTARTTPAPNTQRAHSRGNRNSFANMLNNIFGSGSRRPPGRPASRSANGR